jgi:endonuclease/exonuclease/phosphatase family metal-dependent hydrolase
VVLLAGLLAASPAAASSSSSSGSPRSRDLVVLTYNVKAIPLVTDLDRLKEIGRILAERRGRGDEPDVVLLQEAYSEKSRGIRQRAGYRYEVVGTPEGPNLLFPNPSGLEVLSDHPIVSHQSRSFDDCALPECFVRKSVLAVAIELPDVPVPIQIFNTHLQADTQNDRVRKNQIDDVQTFLRRIGFGEEPAIFAGDLNFKPRHRSFHEFGRELPFFTEVGRHCLEAGPACEVVLGGRTDLNDVWKSNHDRQYFYAPEGSPVRIEPVRLVRNFTERFRGAPLSDHWGYEVRYRLTW